MQDHVILRPEGARENKQSEYGPKCIVRHACLCIKLS